MLKHIPPILSPELLKVLDEMGHGDEMVIADGNFPSCSVNDRVIRLDGHGVPEVLKAVLTLLPLDHAQQNTILMAVSKGDDVETPIWDTYKEIIARHDRRGADAVGEIERFAFYEEAKQAYAIIATGEKAV